MPLSTDFKLLIWKSCTGTEVSVGTFIQTLHLQYRIVSDKGNVLYKMPLLQLHTPVVCLPHYHCASDYTFLKEDTVKSVSLKKFLYLFFSSKRSFVAIKIIVIAVRANYVLMLCNKI